jgi:membrane protease YdiL (CAAX protease family)
MALVAPGVALAGIVALLARPWFLPAGVDLGWRVAFFVALGVVGAAWPLATGDGRARAGLRTSLSVLGVGAAGFAVGRALVEVPLQPAHLGLAVALNALAAVAEEAFFRRYLYGLLAPAWGMAAAVVLTAGAFALVHVTVWGWWVLPLDLAAGLLLSWQRAATGRWSVPAATHVLANTLALL